MVVSRESGGEEKRGGKKRARKKGVMSTGSVLHREVWRGSEKWKSGTTAADRLWGSGGCMC